MPRWAGFAFLLSGNLTRVGRTPSCKATRTGEPEYERSTGASGCLSWSIRRGREVGPTSDRTRPAGLSSPAKPGPLLFVQGKLNEAEAAAQKAAELQPTAAGGHRWQVFVAIQRGDGEAALREAEREPNERYQTF